MFFHTYFLALDLACSVLFAGFFNFVRIPLFPIAYDRKTLDVVDKVFKDNNWD